MVEFTAALLDGGKNYTAFVCGPILLRHMNPVMEQGILAKVKRLALDEVSLMRTLPEIPDFFRTEGPGRCRPPLYDCQLLLKS